MRISDWSSDVCSSDLVLPVLILEPPGTDAELYAPTAHLVDLRDLDREDTRVPEGRRGHHRPEPDRRGVPGQAGQRGPRIRRAGQALGAHPQRAEERRVGKEGGSTCRTRGSPDT